MPQHVLASFTSLADGRASRVLRCLKPTTVCIDWKGGSLSVESYAVADKLETLEVPTYAGAPCTVYGYGAEEPLYVFSLRDAQLADVDLSEMKQPAWANFRASASRSQACLDYAERSRKSRSKRTF